MQPGTMHIYRLGGERGKTYRIDFTTYDSNPSCRVREIHLNSSHVNDINHWKEYIQDNFIKLENGYYEIHNFGKFQRYLDRAMEKPTLHERWVNLPGLAKFLLIGMFLILVTSAYQAITTPQSTQQNTEQR